MVINWPNFNIIVSRGIRRPEESETCLLVEQSEHRHLSIKFAVLCECGSWYSKTINSNIKDHWLKITIANVTIWKSLKYWENYQDVTQRLEASKCCWKNGTDKLAPCRVATDLQFVKNAIFTKHNKMKHNKMRNACTIFQNIIVSFFI